MESKKEVMHTPEPWNYVDHGVGGVCVYDEESQHCIASLEDDGNYAWGNKPVIRHMANARRIVACVNACKGIGTETLEGYHEDHKPENGFGLHREAELIAQRDELLAALKALEKRAGYMAHQCGYFQDEVSELVSARAAIAKCEVKS